MAEDNTQRTMLLRCASPMASQELMKSNWRIALLANLVKYFGVCSMSEREHRKQNKRDCKKKERLNYVRSTHKGRLSNLLLVHTAWWKQIYLDGMLQQKTVCYGCMYAETQFRCWKEGNCFSTDVHSAGSHRHNHINKRRILRRKW